MDVLFETERLICREVDEAVERQFETYDTERLKDDPFKGLPEDAVQEAIKDVNAVRDYVMMLAATRNPADKKRFGAWDRNGELVAYSAGSAWSSGTPELQITVEPEHRGKGYGTEFLSALIQWAFRNYEIKYFIYRHLIDNSKSARIAEKLGGVLQEPHSMIEGLTSRSYFIYRKAD